MSTSSPKRIGIAVIEHDGRYLIGIRGPDGPLPGYAEFPGGKCHPDESAEECAVRETLEETGLIIIIERLLLRREFSYPHATVDLHFFLCHPRDVHREEVLARVANEEVDIAPNEYRSLRRSARRPSTCSGDMNSAVPITAPVIVNCSAANTCATPKSVILMVPS